ncbi:hypothetical protein AAC691_17180 [Nguyenibacter vanlangensis]|uniref:Uncharacterized protein n=1 Tax=Nguyenibacter vanlangensis TaxID=1216886 RepID=A0ABZ3D2L0_9PROT
MAMTFFTLVKNFSDAFAAPEGLHPFNDGHDGPNEPPEPYADRDKIENEANPESDGPNEGGKPGTHEDDDPGSYTPPENPYLTVEMRPVRKYGILPVDVCENHSNQGCNACKEADDI